MIPSFKSFSQLLNVFIFFSIAGMDSCTLCNGGYFSTAGSQTCSMCPLHSTSAMNSSKCSCNAGYTTKNVNDSLTCDICAGGSYSQLGLECLSCAANFYSTSGAISCSKCPPNSFSYKQSQSCVCKSGFSQEGFGKELVCKPCASGSYLSKSK